MERFAHIIKRNKRSEQWRNMLFFDTETWQKTDKDGNTVHRYRLAASVALRRHLKQREAIVWPHPKGLAEYIEARTLPRQRLYVFAHNLYFDFKVCGFHRYFTRNGWETQRFYFAEQSNNCFITFKRDDRSICFIDTLNWFPCKLKKLGESVGIEKQEVDFDTVSRKDLAAYCMVDVEVIERAVIRWHEFLHKEDLGNPQKTIASQAFTTFRHRFMKHDVFIHTTEDALKLERAAYHGGRVECFRLGQIKAKTYHLDVNSMYPSVMQKEAFPVKFERYIGEPVPLPGLRRALQSHFCIAEVDLDTEDEIYPYIHNGRCVYPVGQFSTTLCHGSLREALERGHLKAVRKMAMYRAAPLFADYVGYFWPLRRRCQIEGEKAFDLFTKLLMASLYGKFGQQHREVVFSQPCDVHLWESDTSFYEGKAYQVWRAFGRETWTSKRPKESRESFPGIAAAVTDYARIALWRLIETAGLANVYYTDTDSLFTNKAGFNRLQARMGSDLGQLKLVQAAKDLEIFAPKDYRFGGKQVTKGLSDKAIQHVPEMYWEQESWERIRGSLQAGNKTGYTTKKVYKLLARELKSRRPGHKGMTRPLLVGNEGG